MKIIINNTSMVPIYEQIMEADQGADYLRRIKRK